MYNKNNMSLTNYSSEKEIHDYGLSAPRMIYNIIDSSNRQHIHKHTFKKALII